MLRMFRASNSALFTVVVVVVVGSTIGISNRFQMSLTIHTLVETKSLLRFHFCPLFVLVLVAVVDGFSCTSADFTKSYSFIFVYSSLVSASATTRINMPPSRPKLAPCSTTGDTDDTTQQNTQNNSESSPRLALFMCPFSTQKGLMLHNQNTREHSSAHRCKYSLLKPILIIHHHHHHLPLVPYLRFSLLFSSGNGIEIRTTRSFPPMVP